MKYPEIPARLRKLLPGGVKSPTEVAATDPVEQLKGKDRIGVSGHLLTTASGAVGGGFVGAVLGTTAIPVLTAGAQLVGVTLVASSPIGWVAGGVALGGLGAYALGKAVHSGGRSDQIRADFLRRYAVVKARVAGSTDTPSNNEDLDELITNAVAMGALQETMASRIRAAVSAGKMSRDVAIQRVSELASGVCSSKDA